MNWFAGVIGTASIGLFAYSAFLWWRLRGGSADQPNEFALRAIAQERWMAAGLFGLGALLIALWLARTF